MRLFLPLQSLSDASIGQLAGGIGATGVPRPHH
jgi:hypothetical protein